MVLQRILNGITLLVFGEIPASGEVKIEFWMIFSNLRLNLYSKLFMELQGNESC